MTLILSKQTSGNSKVADSLLDIGGEDVFPLDLNWSSRPKQNFNMSRYLRNYAGTITEIEEKNPENPIIFQASADIYDKETEYDYLTFLHNRRGRTVRFWIKHPKDLFVVKDDLANGSVAIICEENNAHLSFQGFERIYLETVDGDIITRHVSSIVHDAANEEVQLNLATAIDRDLPTDDILVCGRFLLVRFDDDRNRMKIYTDHHVSFTQRFFELVKEYSELAPNP
jgi:hypothetical protein